MNQKTKDTVISVHDLSAVFPNGNGGLRALDHVSFSVYSQEFVCVLGPSGSGKSTLLRILAGLLPVTEGNVDFLGQPVRGPRGDIGFVFQDANLMPWRTVLDNIILPLQLAGLKSDRAKERAVELIELVGLSGFENVLPRDLSGGMAQRVAIARALIHDPDMLLLDEPFGALDAITRDRMGTELLRIWSAKRKTVVMVTHSITEALYLADRVFVLSQRPGRIIYKLEVPFPRPRDVSVCYTSMFGELAQQIRASIGKA